MYVCSIYGDIEDNFRFLVLETKKMLLKTREAIEDYCHKEYILSKMLNKDDYIESLKASIKRKSYQFLANNHGSTPVLINRIMALNTVTDNLERIADYGIKIVRQLEFFSEPGFLLAFDYRPYFETIFRAIELVDIAVLRNQEKAGLMICKSEKIIDEYYLRDLKSIINNINHSMNKENQGENLLTVVHVFGYLERIGDSLLNIGEAVISSVTGNKIRINQYISLKESIKRDTNQPFLMQHIGNDTKSGCQVGVFSSYGEIEEKIYKEGSRKKILPEKDNLIAWDSLFPGMVPRVYNYNEYGSHAKILMEFLQGLNFQQIILSDNGELINNALEALCLGLHYLWSRTFTGRPSRSSFVAQLQNRLNDVYSVHSSLQSSSHKIGDVTVPGLKEKLSTISKLDEELYAPFSMLLHGDLNMDNVIYNNLCDTIHLVDLHRSVEGDYVQDISVFMVSNFRMSFFPEPTRSNLNAVIINFFNFAKDFAKRHDDNTFLLRLALGLSRSFITSTRFQLKKVFSKKMYYRGVYLIDRIIKHKGPYEDFVINEKVMIN